MGLGSALSTAISGLNVNQNTIDVIGNNLANANTPGFKRFRAEFVNNFLSTTSLGSSPGQVTGGTNPRQFGQGARVGALGVDFNSGSPTQTSINSDLFIQGNGFFVVEQGREQLYSRDGSFVINSQAELVTSTGGLNVQGFGVDDDFNVLPTSLVDLTIPLGSLTIARATDVAFMEGDLNPIGDVATIGTIFESADLAAGTAGGDLLTTLTNLDTTTVLPAGFSLPGTLTYTPQKFGRTLTPQTLDVTATTTVDDLLDFISGSLGINTSDVTAGNTPGAVIVAGPPARIEVTGNLGEASSFTIASEDFVLLDSTATEVTFNLPWQSTTTQDADGESVFGQFTVFDSLGSEVVVGVTSYLQNLGNETSSFRLLFESPGQSLDPLNLPAGITNPFQTSVGSALLTFDRDGQLETAVGNNLTIHRNNTGATDPLTFEVNVDEVSALAVEFSRLAIVSQDGSPPGTLIDFAIDDQGIIQGAFDNGQTRQLGQVVLARFNNKSGLIALAGNLFREGPNSGLPFVTEPGAGVGTILSGFLELSNVDIGSSFVDLLTASTSFSANSRVIATTQDLFQTLLQLPR